MLCFIFNFSTVLEALFRLDILLLDSLLSGANYSKVLEKAVTSNYTDWKWKNNLYLEVYFLTLINK